MSKSSSVDDTFELYDLRVEVICPPGQRIMCGAKEGDHFTLEGEMLYLPPGQGFSIYSLGIVLYYINFLSALSLALTFSDDGQVPSSRYSPQNKGRLTPTIGCRLIRMLGARTLIANRD